MMEFLDLACGMIALVLMILGPIHYMRGQYARAASEFAWSASLLVLVTR